MTEDLELIKKNKYRILKRKLDSIKNDLNSLNSLYQDMYSTSKKGLFIDGKVILEDSYKLVSKNILDVRNDLNSVLNSVNSKC